MGMSMTTEEKKKRRQERRVAREEDCARLPSAYLSTSRDQMYVSLRLEPGVSESMEIRVGESGKGTRILNVLIDNMEDLADFITALIARYNDHVDSVNLRSAKCPKLRELSKIQGA